MRRVALLIAVALMFAAGSPASRAGWVLDGSPVTIQPVPGVTGGNCSVDPTGQIMLYGSGSSIYEAQWNQSLKSWTNNKQLSLGSGNLGWEAQPCWSIDGKYVFYTASNGTSTSRLYRSEYKNGSFSAGVAVGGAVNSGSYNPSTPMFDGTDLYFRNLVSSSQYDIYKASYNPVTNMVGTPSSLGSKINDGHVNDCPYVVNVNGTKTLLFDREAGGPTSGVLMESTWNKAGYWNDPVKLDAPFNQSGYSVAPRYSAANDTLYFNKDGTVWQAESSKPKTYVLCVGVEEVGGDKPVRGDVVAKMVQNRFGNFNQVTSSYLKLKSDASGMDNYNSLVQEITNMKKNVKLGDTFVMYLASHGYQNNGTDELSVQIQYDPDNPDLRKWNSGDEFVWLSATGSDVSDDQVHSLFGETGWGDVNKLIIVDACYSGGFWGSTLLGDTGDLASLSHCALLAAAAEGDFGYATLDSATGCYLHNLGMALCKALDDLEGKSSISFQQLVDQINLESKVFIGSDGVITGTTGLENQWGVTYRGAPDFRSYSTSDFSFTLSSALPEPSTLVVWSVLGSFGLLAAYQRRRRVV